MKLRTKLSIALVTVLLLLSSVSYVGLSVYQDRIIEDQTEAVEESAELTAEQINSNIQGLEDQVALYANRHPGTNLSDSREFLERFRDTTKFWGLTIVNASGRVVSVSAPLTEEGREQLLGQDVSDETYFRRAMEDGVNHVTDPQPLPGYDDPLVEFSAPIRGPDNEIVGVLVAAHLVDRTEFFGMIGPLETTSQTVTVTGANGDVLDEPHRQFNATIEATAEVESMDWTVRITRDRSELNELLDLLALLQGLLLVAVFGSVVGFGVWEYRSNLRQTERLLAGFDRIKTGDYDYRLSLSSAQEWRQIGDGFNDLAEGLAEREAAIREREQRLSVLNRVIRHNLRNEMSVILNYADIVRDFSDDSQIESAAETILDTGRLLVGLSDTAREIENALETADEGLIEQDAVQMVEESLANLESDHPDVEVDLRTPPEQSVAGIKALPAAVEEVCENAMKHNDSDEPRVAIAIDEVRRSGRRKARIRIADNGPGIPEQEKEVLTKGRETDLEHGSGLGLWLVYWVVDKSEGVLRFDENDPSGSIVTMELYAEVPDAEADADADTESEEAQAVAADD